MTNDKFFVTGGALMVDANSYVQRVADTELVTALRAGEFCYVLTTRQMGKTSLTVRAAAQLREEGWAVVVLDLTAFGQNLDVEQWYFSMLSDVAEKLQLEEEMEADREANARRSPLHRFFGALREVYLERKDKPLVIFVDEIDMVRSLRQFKADEFFAGIRECYNRRADDPQYQRLTFCLLGVATPSDLISDQRMTPFNIGHGIELDDFTFEETAVLAGGLSPNQATARALLERVMEWTSGHPYLTQRLCAELAKAGVRHAGQVDAVCKRLFLANDARTGDENLQFVRERLLRSELDQAALLDTYARVCRGEIVADDHHHPIINELRLCGIVRIAESRLQPRNRIYSRVFDSKWVREHLPDAEAQRQRAAYYRGVRRVAGAAIGVSLLVGGLAFKAWQNARKANEASEQAQLFAEKAMQAAEEERHAAEREKKAAAGEKLAMEGEMKAAAQARAAEAQAKESLAQALAASELAKKNEAQATEAAKRETLAKERAQLEAQKALTAMAGEKTAKEGEMKAATQAKEALAQALAASALAKKNEAQATEAAERALKSADGEKLAKVQAQMEAQKAITAAAGEKLATERAQKAATAATEAAARALKSADGEKLAKEQAQMEARKTLAALQRLVDTQAQVQTLLEAFTPLIGQKAGKPILDQAEKLVQGFSEENDPRILLGQVGLRQVCGRLYLRSKNKEKALEQAEGARQLILNELKRPPSEQPDSWKPDPAALTKSLHDCHRLVGDVFLAMYGASSAEKSTEEGYDRVRTAYGEALQLAREQCAARPEDKAWRESYFEDLRTLGDSARVLNHDSEAEKLFLDSIAELNALRKSDPAASALDWIKASFHDGLGTLYLSKDNIPKARVEFDIALRLRETGPGESPSEDPERLSDLAVSFNKLGNVALVQKNFKEALAFYERCLVIREKLCEQNPRVDWQRQRGFTLSNIAQVLLRWGRDNAQARRRSEERFKLAGELLEQDPSEPNLQSDYSNALFGYADILLNVKDNNLRDWPRALEIARQAVVNTNREDPRILVLYAQALRLNKRELEARGVVEEAMKLLPPEDRRNQSEKETAQEVDFEAKKTKAGSPGTGPAPKKSPKKKR